MTIPRGALRTTGFVLGGLTALACAFFLWLQTVASRSWSGAGDGGRRRGAGEGPSTPRHPRRGGSGQRMGGVRAGPGPGKERRGRGCSAAGSTAPLRRTGRRRRQSWPRIETAIDFLRAGARKAEGAYPTQWEKGVSADLPSLIAVRNLSTLAVGQARVLVEAGKPREAADLLLDAAQFGADLGRNTVLMRRTDCALLAGRGIRGPQEAAAGP